MEFGPVPVAAAEGAILAHSLRAGELRLKKGTRLGADHVAALRGAGRFEVVVARPGPGDVDEDRAAAQLARALAGPGLRATPAATGRVNLHAVGPGLARIDAGRIAAVNAIDPAITVATLPEWQRCDDGTMVATVKIIPYAAPGAALARACAAAEGALSLAPPVVARAALIETETGARRTTGKGAAAVAARLARLGAEMDGPVRVPHETGPLARALAEADAPLRLILTGSATSDIADTAPAALRAAGGEVLHFGMPVDPGNLLFLGRLAEAWVIGLPGCARSPALNGADWVMERVICGVHVGPREIAGMGVGGLLKEIPTRPRPRDHGSTG